MAASFRACGGNTRHDNCCWRVSWVREAVRSFNGDSSAPPLRGAEGRRRSRMPVAQRGVAQMDRLRGYTLANLMLERRRHQFRSAKPRQESVAKTSVFAEKGS